MIKLRKIEPNDLPFLYQWENDAASWADGANHNPLSQQDLRDYIASTTGDIYRDGQLRLIIEQITNDQSPGASSRQTEEVRDRSAEKGYHQSPITNQNLFSTSTFSPSATILIWISFSISTGSPSIWNGATSSRSRVISFARIVSMK